MTGIWIYKDAVLASRENCLSELTKLILKNPKIGARMYNLSTGNISLEFTRLSFVLTEIFEWFDVFFLLLSGEIQ